MTNSVDPDQTAPIGAVCSGSMLFASILNLSVILCKYLQQTTSTDDIFRYIFFLGALRVNCQKLVTYFFQSQSGVLLPLLNQGPRIPHEVVSLFLPSTALLKVNQKSKVIY